MGAGKEGPHADTSLTGSTIQCDFAAMCRRASAARVDASGGRWVRHDVQEEVMKVQVSVDITRPRWLPRGPRSVRRGFLIFALALTALLPMSLVASDTFTDVPETYDKHDAINAIAEAGITGGCTPTLYCPQDAVKRGTMAAFMHRGFGRVAQWRSPAPAGGRLDRLGTRH